MSRYREARSWTRQGRYGAPCSLWTASGSLAEETRAAPAEAQDGEAAFLFPSVSVSASLAPAAPFFGPSPPCQWRRLGRPCEAARRPGPASLVERHRERTVSCGSPDRLAGSFACTDAVDYSTNFLIILNIAVKNCSLYL